jgi:copper(I)-binding protein
MNDATHHCSRFPAGRAAGIAAMLGVVLAFAPALASAVLIVHVPWVLPAAKGGATDAFMEVTSLEGAFLVGGRSAVARSTVLVAPGAKLRPVDRLPLPPGAPVILVPGSYRLHLEAVDRTLTLGSRVPLVLTFETADGARQEINVEAEVRRRSATDDHLRGHLR